MPALGVLPAAARAWAEAVAEEDDPEAWLCAYAEAPRRLGKATAALARTYLIEEACRRRDEDAEALLDECWRRGDNEERAALLRALPALPHPQRFRRLAEAACRTHVLPVFEAIACDNPYPAEHFSDRAFHHLVLKALFLGVPVARIVGLGSRLTPELVQMAADYARELEAAGRPVSPDVRQVSEGRTP